MPCCACLNLRLFSRVSIRALDIVHHVIYSEDMTGKTLQQALIEAVSREILDLDAELSDWNLAQIEKGITNVIRAAWDQAIEEGHS